MKAKTFFKILKFMGIHSIVVAYPPHLPPLSGGRVIKTRRRFKLK